jgi:transcriptional regulator with XRE-family HTH domain
MQKTISETKDNKAKKEFSKRLGKNLRKIREAKGLSQEQLALEADFYRTYVGHIETGRYSPTVYTIWRLAKALGVTISDITANL